MARGEPAEDFFGEIDRHRADRDRPPGDAGLGAHFFGDVEGALKKFIQVARGGSRRRRRRVGFFDLAEDFRFADDH